MIYCTRLRSTGKQTLLRSEDTDLRPGETVIAEAEAGLDVATILYRKEDDEESGEEITEIKRKAGEDDLRKIEENAKTEAEGRYFCIDRIRTRDLPMKLVSTALTFDRKKFSFYFTAEKRVDFRELVKDLASKFRTRIELRQIGIRDEAKLVGGIGSCGREVCCKLFLNQFAPISIKMAKGQDIALNPTKISGLCGRLMCCLNYEHAEVARKGRRKESGEYKEKDRNTEEVTVTLDDETPLLEPLTQETSGQTGPAETEQKETVVQTAVPATGTQTAEQPAKQGRRKRRRGRRGQGQKPQSDQPASVKTKAEVEAGTGGGATDQKKQATGDKQAAPARKPKRRRRRKPAQEQKS